MKKPVRIFRNAKYNYIKIKKKKNTTTAYGLNSRLDRAEEIISKQKGSSKETIQNTMQKAKETEHMQ